MWNHVPTMLAVAPEDRIEYPSFVGREMIDLLGFLRQMSRRP